MTDETVVYPRIYETSKVGKWFCLILLILLIMMIGAGSVILWPETLAKAKFLALTGPLFFAACFSHWAVKTLRGRLTLYEDRLTYRCWASTTVYKHDIKRSRKMTNEAINFSIILVMNDPKRQELTISAFGPLDLQLAEWLDDFPNTEFDADFDRSKRLLGNPAFGPEATREKVINSNARWITWLGWGSYAVGFWTMAQIVPPIFAIGPNLTWLVMLAISVAIFRARLCLSEDVQENRLGVGQLVIWPSIFLAGRALTDAGKIQEAQTAQLMILTSALVILLVLITILLEGRLKITATVKCLILYLAIGFGLVVELNALIDIEAVRTTKLTVVDAYVSQENSRSYYFKLSNDSSKEWHVSRDLFSRTRIGGTVCVNVHSGLMRIRWHDIQDCAASKP